MTTISSLRQFSIVSAAATRSHSTMSRVGGGACRRDQPIQQPQLVLAVLRRQTISSRNITNLSQQPSPRSAFPQIRKVPVKNTMQPENVQSPPQLPPPTNLVDGANIYLVLVQRAAIAMGLVYILTEYVADITLCEGPSMAPTIRPFGEIVLIDKMSLRRGIQDGLIGTERAHAAQQRQKLSSDDSFWHEPYIAVSELQEKIPFTWWDALHHMRSPIARGDVVVSQHPGRSGTVCKRLAGLPGDQILQPNGSIQTVPDGHVWLEGDNPGNSSDSRAYGALPVALLQGRVAARLWPLRGTAWMRRGVRPTNGSISNSSGSTILPAGYQGEHIIKHVEQKEQSN